MRTKKQRGRVIIIGLDGAEPEIVEKMCADGRLPGLGALMEKGVYSRIRSTTPAHSGPAWTSIVTGKNPGKTGIFSFLKIVPGEYRQEFFSSTGLPVEPIWRIANSQGFTAGLINVFHTYPPEKLDGYVLSWQPTNDYRFCPEPVFIEAFKNIQKQFDAPKSVAFWNDCYRAILKGDVNRKNIFMYLNEKHPADLQIAVFDLADRLQHRYWHCMDETHPAHTPELAASLGDAIETGYRILDGFVSEIVGKLGPEDMLFVVSDHGMRACRKIFHLNNFLMDNGYLYLKRGFDAPEFLAKIKEEAYNTALYENVDWKRTKAFVTNEDLMVCSGLRLNVRGREARGTVSPGAEYTALREEIRNAVQSLRDPETGESFIKKVHRREEIYSGPYVDLAPDLLIESSYLLSPVVVVGGLFSAIEPKGIMTKTEYFSSRDLTGHHSKHGIFFAYGNGIAGNLESAELADIAPTALHALGAAIPMDMDGKVLPVFSKKHTNKHPVQFEEPVETKKDLMPYVSPDDMKAGVKILKGLGYID